MHDAEIEDSDSGVEVNYMSMKLIDGQTPKACWDTLIIDEKKGTRTNYFIELRSSPSPKYHSFLEHLQCKNIIVKKKGVHNPSRKDWKYEVTPIDWEEAGWYPGYQEYTLAAHASGWEADWPNRLPKLMDPYDL
ncbi:hypothetical protein TRV_02359 [Trichophyton verrucosum HKI 0517]|uniref:Uncharacterized protein n=1 Tax=Trichophyton verrucosum (strain HKI 0517) TaxID=663202 RepID=D4D5I8_TRIVH|nr:uncharacterized protein TRV_02359 [Trichophyton verrucosum HKI 0517]EFE42890.1 hypothetical protein TRV_02359 [Trichophyton verrucosum HKI 0517]